MKSKQSLLLIKHSQCYSKSSEVKFLLRHLAKKQSQVQLPAKVESSYFSIMSIPSWLYRVLYVVSLKPTNINIHQFCYKCYWNYLIPTFLKLYVASSNEPLTSSSYNPLTSSSWPLDIKFTTSWYQVHDPLTSAD